MSSPTMATRTEDEFRSSMRPAVSKDAAENLLQTVDKSTKQMSGVSLFHILTLGSIGASIALFLSGKKEAGIFVGLWPPTFQALKAVVDKTKEEAQ